MKYVSFAVPCYNSQAYMRKCVDSLLCGGEEVEIIIVNDGSKDGTLAIAREYEEKYPSIVRVVDKENGGHGSGVNAGLRLAEGLYYKVVDSDDWVNEEALYTLLETIKRHEQENALPDLYIVNYVYEHAADNTSHVSKYASKFPAGHCGWKGVKAFHYSHMLLMHALVYKTEVLRASGLVLPEHTFYVDDIFSYNPLPYAKKLFYLDIDFYRYFIGRADQSVNIVNMVKRYEQMIRVMLQMTDCWTYAEIKGQAKGTAAVYDPRARKLYDDDPSVCLRGGFARAEGGVRRDVETHQREGQKAVCQAPLPQLCAHRNGDALEIARKISRLGL